MERTANTMPRRQFLALQAGASAIVLTRQGMAQAGTPSTIVDVVREGAIPDGKTKCTTALQRAIDKVNLAGGGLVYVPPGTYLTGGLELRSRVTLYLEAGAVLLGSSEIADYTPRAGMGIAGDANAHHLLFARDAEHVTVCGQGIVDGQGKAFWKPSGRPRPAESDMWKDVIAWDWVTATYMRPSPMLEFAGCTDLVLEGITIRNASGWTLRPVNCQRVHINGVRIENPNYGPNTDGIDITNCQDVIISSCIISTGDDAICLKSDLAYGKLLPTRNVVVTGCTLTTCCNGFKFGTATHGVFENIVFSDSVIHNGPQPLNERVIAGIGINMVDGGSIDGVTISNIMMQRVRTPIFLRLGRRTPSTSNSFLRHISIVGVQANEALLTSSITGLPDLRIEDVLLSEIEIRTAGGQSRSLMDEPVPELPEQYPEARMFGRLPAFGLYARHTDGLRIRNARFHAAESDGRPTIFCDDVSSLELASVSGYSGGQGQPDLQLTDTRDAFVHGNSSSRGASSLLAVSGNRSTDIRLAGNAVRSETKLWTQSDEVPVGSVIA